MRKIVSILCVLAITSWADTIATDRPGYSGTANTVAPGRVNVETGYQYSWSKSAFDLSTQTAPYLSLRTGVTDAMEFGVIWDGWSLTKKANTPEEQSHADPSLGGKYKLYEGEQSHLTLRAFLTLPTGSEGNFFSEINPLLGVLWDYSLSDAVKLYGMEQVLSYREGGERITEAQLSLASAISISEKFGSFLEFYSYLPFEHSVDRTIVFDGGFTYLLNDDVQFDVSAGLGLNSSSQNYMGVGFSFRL